MSPLSQALRKFTQVLEQRGIEYAIMGGLAVRLYGLPRATFDVDLTMSVEHDDLAQLFDRVDELGFSVPEQFRSGWVDLVAGMPLVKLRWYIGERGIDIDCFLSATEFQRSLLRRRRREDLDGWVCSVVTVEDLVLLKLLAERPRDLADLADIRLVQGDMDEGYLRKWAHELEITEALERFLKQD